MIKDLFDLNDYDEFKNEIQSLIYRKKRFSSSYLQNNQKINHTKI